MLWKVGQFAIQTYKLLSSMCVNIRDRRGDILIPRAQSSTGGLPREHSSYCALDDCEGHGGNRAGYWARAGRLTGTGLRHTPAPSWASHPGGKKTHPPAGCSSYTPPALWRDPHHMTQSTAEGKEVENRNITVYLNRKVKIRC